MNVFSEYDLNKKIDSLTQASAEQKRTIAELQCKMVAIKFDSVDVLQVSYLQFAMDNNDSFVM